MTERITQSTQSIQGLCNAIDLGKGVQYKTCQKPGLLYEISGNSIAVREFLCAKHARQFEANGNRVRMVVNGELWL